MRRVLSHQRYRSALLTWLAIWPLITVLLLVGEPLLTPLLSRRQALFSSGAGIDSLIPFSQAFKPVQIKRRVGRLQTSNLEVAVSCPDDNGA